MPLTAYAKAIAAFVATLAAAFVAANTDQHISALELQQLLALATSSALVLIVPTLPTGWGRYTKPALAFLGAAVTVALPIIEGSAGLNEWIIAVLAGLQAIGVAGLPNEGYVAKGSTSGRYRRPAGASRVTYGAAGGGGGRVS